MFYFRNGREAMNYSEIVKMIKDETGVEFKVYNSSEEAKITGRFPYELVTCGENIEHLTILKSAGILKAYFDYFTDIKSLAFYCSSSEFDMDSLRCFKNLTSLNIRENNLKKLPTFIGDLKNLTSLDISFNNLEELPTFIGDLKNLTSLDIEKNNLIELPTFIGELSNLTSLSIRKNYQKELPTFIGELSNLTSLDISFNNLNGLPVFIGGLKNLTTLCIGGNNLNELPAFIGEMKNLTSLYNTNNNLKELPTFIGDLKNLTSLSFGGNKLKELPTFLGELSKLTSLNIRGNNLNELPSFIGKLKNLTLLSIGGNNLNYLPTFIGDLKNITSLYIGNNKLRELPAFIGELKSLTSLDISNNNIKELPTFIGELKNLTSLDISSNNIKELPAFIGELKNLSSLDISNNNIKELPCFLGKLKNLMRLDISFLNLCHIPKEVVDLDIPFSNNYVGRCLIFSSGMTLDRMDVSLFEQPYELIKKFYEAGFYVLKECKLILLGEGGSGKTCLTERLISGRYPEENPSPTEGILIKDWKLRFSNGDEPRIRVMDFSGQEIMYSMHTCFLTSRTVYLVVLDGRQDSQNDTIARNWMEIIRTYAPGSPVIIVISKVDDEVSRNSCLNVSDLKEEYSNLLCVEKVSAKDGTNIEGLKNRIQCAIEHNSGYMHYFNSNWMQIKSDLENMNDNYISDKVYDGICKKYGLNDDYFKKYLLKWFKVLGITYYYYESGDFSQANKKYRVLNPKWLTDGIYTLILKTPPDTGLLKHSVIRNALAENRINETRVTYNDEEIEFILCVMRQYEISLIVENDTEFIPSKLDKNKPEFSFDKIKSLHLSWEAKYIPNIVLHRLMVKYFNVIDKTCMWRTGALFSDFDGGQYKYKVLIEKTDTRMDLYVHSKFEEPRIYLQKFRETINDFLKNIGASEYINYTYKGEPAKDLYIDVLTQFVIKPGNDIYLSGIRGFADPHIILEQVFTNDSIINKVREHKGMNVVVSNSTIKGDVIISEQGDAFKQQGYFNQMAERIKNTSGLSDVKLDEILAELKNYANNDRMARSVRDELIKTITEVESSDKSKWWKYIQILLGDAANLAALATLGFEIMNFLK